MLNETWGRQCAIIAAALPGLFSLRDLYEMDLRDFEFWLNEADRANRMSEVRMANASRFAQATEAKDFIKYIEGLFRDDEDYGAYRTDQVKQSWDELRARKRG